MKVLWCWRCRMDIPMLDADEWAEVHRALEEGIRGIEADRETEGSELTSDLVPRFCAGALDAYERITGFRETNPNALWHHRIALYGPPCPICGKPLRTPKAKLCAACGWGMESGQPAEH